MIRNRLFWRLFGANLALVLITALLALWVARDRIRDEADMRTQQLLESKLPLTRHIARPLLQAEPTAESQAMIARLGKASDVRITIIAADGVVLADSDDVPSKMENHAHRPEVLDAQRDGRGRSRRRSQTVDADMMYLAERVDDPDDPEAPSIGTVRIAIPLLDLQEQYAAIQQIALYAGLVASIVGALLSLVIATRLARPAHRLMRAAEAIAEGRDPERVEVRGRGSFAQLAHAFNHMTEELSARIERIRRDRQEVAAILGGMEEGVVAVDRQGRVVLMNHAAGRILRVDPDENAGKALWEGVPIHGVASATDRALREGEGATEEIRLRSAEGERAIRLHVSPLFAPEIREPSGAVIVLHDITELRRLERVRQDFVANASHELKTPLASIRGYVETILEDPEMDPGTKSRFLEGIRRQTTRLSNLVEEMLELSRLESTAFSKRGQPLDLRVAIEEARELVLPLARERQVEIRIQVPDAPVTVNGSQESLRRIAGNLLDNAVKYAREQGRVEVRLDAAGEGGCRMVVRDDGPGIPPAERERVFERFYRVDRGRSRDVGGTGLGLAIVKHLTQALGGDVRVTGDPGEGATFVVELPAAATPIRN